MKMSNYEEVNNLISVDPYDEFKKIDIITPERTVIDFKRSNLHIYRACYLRRVVGSNPPRKSIDKSSVCKKRCKLVANLIRESRKQAEHYFTSIMTAFAWIDDNNRSDLIYTQKEAVETYRLLSEDLYREARLSSVRANSDTTIKKRSRNTLSKIQTSAILIISTSVGLSKETIKRSAVKIERFGTYSDSQKKPDNADEIQISYAFNLRHFESIADYFLNNKSLPLVIPRTDLGYPDLKIWSMKLDSEKLSKWKETDNNGLAYFDVNDEFIFDPEVAKVRRVVLGLKRYEGRNHKSFIESMTNGVDKIEALFLRRASAHFAYLLLMASGCNPEQLEYINFSKELKSNGKALRETAIKPRTEWENRPVIFSANFLPTWRTFIAIRKVILERFNLEFGDYGIPLTRGYNTGKRAIENLLMGNSKNLVEVSSLAFPEGIENPTLPEGRDFKTINHLENSNGNIALVSLLMGRTPDTTRKHYSYNSFEGSAKQLDSYFRALIGAASIKEEGYSSEAPIYESAQKIHTGRCDSDRPEPIQIKNVTELAPEPRCGASVTCFFCEHYGHHADIDDLKTILATRAWVEKQTKFISRSIDEHASKFLPIIERIDDITSSFRSRSDEYESIYQKAHKEISSGKYPRYWRNKIDALLDALEV